MSFVHLRDRWRKQPRVPSVINWNHPLAVDLRFFVAFLGGAGFDYVTNAPGTKNGSANARVSGAVANGGGWAASLASASSDFYSWSDIESHDITGSLTLAWRGTLASGGSAFRHFAGKHASNGATANPFDFRTDGTASQRINLSRANGGSFVTFTSVTGLTPSVTQPQAVEVTNISMGDSPVFYVNGLVAGTTGTPIAGNATGSTTGLRIGRRSDGAVQHDGTTEYVVGWARVQSAEVLAEFRREPYGLFVPRTTRLYFAGTGSGAASGAGSSSLTFVASATGAANKPAAGTSSLTFAATAAGAANKPGAGSSSITFGASAVGTTGGNTVGAGSSSITFAATGAGASIRAATGSSSITFSASAVSTAPAVDEAAATLQGGHSPAQRKRRRYILPDDTEVMATDVEIRDILKAFVKPKPQPKKRGQVAKVVPLSAQVQLEPDPIKKAERVVVDMNLATWTPDQQMLDAMVRQIVTTRRRRVVELLLMAA